LDEALTYRMYFSKLTFLAVFAFYVSTVCGTQNWYNLKLPFAANPLFGFYDQPRTASEAESAGWTKVDDDSVGCKDVNGGRFWGYRYAPPGEYQEMLLIYDVSGYIAGMQSVVPIEDAHNDQYYKFSTSPMYNLDDGVGAYLTTAYFVDPSIICDGGRTQEDFDRDGTGYVLFFQNGETPADLYAAPLTAAEATGTEWYEHYCFVNMGNHFFQFYYDRDQPCDEGFPAQLIYDHQGDHPLVGFVWQHLAGIKGDRWEVLNKMAVDAIVNTAPSCLYPLLETPGGRTQHVYLKDWKETCLF